LLLLVANSSLKTSLKTSPPKQTFVFKDLRIHSYCPLQVTRELEKDIALASLLYMILQAHRSLLAAASRNPSNKNEA
jgi:hypothetical protein